MGTCYRYSLVIIILRKYEERKEKIGASDANFLKVTVTKYM